MKTLREYIELIKEADGVTNPWPAGTPHAQAWDTMSPEDKKWLGGADPTDKYILMRAPNKGKPVAPAAVATPVADPTPVVATPLPAAPEAPTQVAAPTPTPSKPPAGQAAKPTGPNPVLTLQNKLIGLGAKIKADGLMGPQTQAAMKEYGLDANGNPVKDAKTGQPVTNDKTANAIIQRGGVAPAEITPDMTSAQQARSNIEGQRANAHLNNVAPGSLKDKRNQIDAEYQAQNQAFLAKQAEAKAAAQGAKPAAPATTPAAPAPASGSVPPAPVNPKEKAAWARQYGGKYDPTTGAPLSESTGYDEIDRLIGLVHYR